MFLVLVVLLCVVAAMPTTQPLPLPIKPQSHIDECVSVLEFRANFTIEPYYALRKLQPWKIKKGDNCCGWDGVQCDPKDGHVVGLDLSDSGFRGSIDSGSTLFRLSHLQNLNLGGIYMGSSTIPPAIGNLSRLTSLNLSLCGFLAPLPISEFSGLTKLSSLDLSGNVFLDAYDIGNLTKSLPKLEQLRLSYLHLNSFPTGIENLSSLTSLIIDHSDLAGNFPVAIFKLPKLEHVDIGVNPQLSGYFPEFQSWSRLKSISVSFTNFSGELPLSLGNLGSLNVLDVSNCYFRGSIPSSLSNLTKLTILRLSINNFHGPVPCLASLSNLTSLELSKNHLSGDVLSYIGTHTMLERLDLSYNNFTGPVPYGFGNLTRLVYLDLASNRFHGEVDLDLLLHLNKDIRILRLQFNNLSVIANSEDVEMNDSRPSNHLRDLQLAYCNLQEFPKVLQNQTELFRLDLSSNNMKGAIPVWFKTISSESLVLLNLSHNSLTGFVVEEEEDVDNLGSWRILGSLDLRYNELQGSLPPPPPSIFDYLVSNNKLTGEISSHLFCNCSNIQTIELSNNRLNGTIPECLSSTGTSLRILSLHGNNFSGTIPSKLFQEGKCVNLQMIDFSDNQLQGSLPRSLSSCVELRLLNFGGNNIRDTFPSWLFSVIHLRVLILGSNNFHGEILEDGNFSSLNIIDISHNEFTGYLPTRQIDGWTSMKADSQQEPREYLRTTLPTYLTYDRGINDDAPLFLDGLTSYDFSMKIVNKGSEMVYEKILNYLMVVDLSSNNFIGRVPSSIASLVRLHQLNLSNNVLTGPIPAFLGDLMKLEALDLSHNNFSGKIPGEITRLNFLGVFNVSYNNLSGRIPQGGQFDTFLNSSYVDNQGLCGVPVSRKCETDHITPPASWKNGDVDDGESSERQSSVILEWKAVVVGYATSFIIAAIISLKFITVRPPFRLGTQEIRRRRQR